MQTFKVLILLSFLASCAPKIINTKTTSVRDSIVTKIVHHRDTVRIKGDSIKVVVKETVHDTTIVQKHGRAELDITKHNGKTTTKCKCDSIQKALDIVLKDTTRYRTITNDNVRTIEVKFIPGFYRFTFWSFWIIVAIIFGGIIYRFRKLLPAPFNLIP